MCSVHPFCFVTGSEEEHSPVLKTLERRAARKLPSKSLEDIPSDSSSENKVCPMVHASPKLTDACVLVCSSVVSRSHCMPACTGACSAVVTEGASLLHVSASGLLFRVRNFAFQITHDI